MYQQGIVPSSFLCYLIKSSVKTYEQEFSLLIRFYWGKQRLGNLLEVGLMVNEGVRCKWRCSLQSPQSASPEVTILFVWHERVRGYSMSLDSRWHCVCWERGELEPQVPLSRGAPPSIVLDCLPVSAPKGDIQATRDTFLSRRCPHQSVIQNDLFPRQQWDASWGGRNHP